MKESIAKYLPADTKVYGGEGGYFVWVVTLMPMHTKLLLNWLNMALFLLVVKTLKYLGTQEAGDNTVSDYPLVT